MWRLNPPRADDFDISDQVRSRTVRHDPPPRTKLDRQSRSGAQGRRLTVTGLSHGPLCLRLSGARHLYALSNCSAHIRWKSGATQAARSHRNVAIPTRHEWARADKSWPLFPWDGSLTFDISLVFAPTRIAAARPQSEKARFEELTGVQSALSARVPWQSSYSNLLTMILHRSVAIDTRSLAEGGNMRLTAVKQFHWTLGYRRG